MNPALSDADTPALFGQSATGDAIPDSTNVKFVRRAAEPLVPVRFTVLEYGDYTKQIYDGDDRATADNAWSGVKRGVFLGTTVDHACMALDKR